MGNEALKNQVEYDSTKIGANILEKYDELKTGPTGFVIGGTTVGVIDETDPEKRLAILTALSDKQSLEQNIKFQSDMYTADEMQKFRKPPKKKAKRRKADTKNKEDEIGDMKEAGAGRPQDAGSDEEDPELYEQLSKQRRLVRRSDAGAMKKGEAALAAVSDRIALLEDPVKKEEEEKEKE